MLLRELYRWYAIHNAGAGERMLTVGKRMALTICSLNYLAYAKILQETFRLHNEGVPLIIFIADRPQLTNSQIGSDEIVYIDATVAPNFEDMAVRYTIMEYNTAVKPHCIEYLMDQCGATEVLYLDPDIYITAPLHHLYDLMQGSFDCLLTPHILAPLNDGKNPDDLAIARAGTFNLGFIGVTNRSKARKFLDWWRGWLESDCVVDLERGIFVDQRFCDFAPSFVDTTCILHDPGLNLAYWNLHQRPLELCGEKLHASGSPVKFVHFSGISKSDPHRFSKHQDRLTRDDIGALLPLYDHYIHLLHKHDCYEGGVFSEIPYGFSRFGSGEILTDIHRMCIRRYRLEVPVGVSAYDLPKEFFVAPADTNSGDPISRLLMTIYNARGDLRKIFDISNTAGRNALRGWAMAALQGDYKVDPSWAVPDVIDAPPPRRFVKVAKAVRAAVSKNFGPKPKLATRSSEAVTHVDRPAPLPELKHGLAVYGFLQAETGMGRAGRALAEAWMTTGLPISLHSMRPSYFKNEVAFASADTMANQMDTALLAINADNVRNLSSLIEPRLIARNRKFGLFFWELPVFPGIWAQAGESLDEVWVSTNFVKDSLSSAVTKPVRVIPLPVPLNERDPISARGVLGFPTDRLIFLVTFDYNSFPQRKNPLAAVRAFLEAFPSDKMSGPMLVVKSHGLTNRDIWEQALVDLAAPHPHVRIVDAVFSDENMLNLQAACDVYVSLHRSEGFGLNIAESMAARKLTIATNFSGNVDFMTSENSMLIGYGMRRVEGGEYPLATGQWWAEPNHDESVEAMRTATSQSVRARLGEQARKDVARMLSAETIGRKMAAFVN